MYICPICKKALELNERTLKCAGGHSFDLHRKGYVNLLTTKKHNPKKSGDNGDMVRARTEFLDFGHYERLAQRAAQIMGELTADCKEPVIIDSGCGAMAKAGSGDVLSGIITGLLARGYQHGDACIMGMYLHGLAGDLAAKELGMESMVASDIIKYLPKAFQRIND